MRIVCTLSISIDTVNFKRTAAAIFKVQTIVVLLLEGKEGFRDFCGFYFYISLSDKTLQNDYICTYSCVKASKSFPKQQANESYQAPNKGSN